jgi:hypothetical protein
MPMNKKYSVLMAIIMLFSSGLSFAMQGDSKYQAIVKLHDNLKLSTLTPEQKSEAAGVIGAHKKELEARKKSIESSYVPMVLKIAASSLVIFSAAAFGTAIGNAFGAYAIFKGQNRSFVDYSKNFWMNTLPVQLELIKAPTIDILGVPIMEKSIEGVQVLKKEMNLSQPEFDIVGLGVYAPALVTGSLVAVSLSRYLFNKATSYKTEVKKLEGEIASADAMLRILR